MQAILPLACNATCNSDMQTGRPPKTERSEVGARIHALREAAGFSQAEIAEQLGITQQSYAAWERHTPGLSPKRLQKLAAIFGVKTVDFFNDGQVAQQRGPIGRAKKAFDAVAKLPRNRQTRVLDFVESLVRVHQRELDKKSS
jgi:transcriptional regulator with XRE-family HTH domain